MLGSSLKKFVNLEEYEILAPDRATLDLSDRKEVFKYLSENQPEVIIHAAALVGGISANIANQFDFLSKNIRMDANLLGAARDYKIPKLIYIGSSCMYPKNLTRAMREEEILTGPLEPTNEGYALAKLVGWKSVQFVASSESLTWRTVILSNMYGPKDHFEPSRSHLLAAIIEKVSVAKADNLKTVDMWGDGSNRREFTYVDDVAKFLIESLPRLVEFPDTLNIGAGVDHSVREYYEMVVDVLNYHGEVRADLTKPTGMKRKLMNVAKAKKLGWRTQTSIEDGIRQTVNWYKESQDKSTHD